MEIVPESLVTKPKINKNEWKFKCFYEMQLLETF